MSVSKSTPTAKKTIVVTKSAVEKKPATKKITAKSASKSAPAKAATPKPRATKPVVGAKPAPAKSKAAKGNGATPITPEQRYRMICDAAYYRAERRGFIGGNSAEDWAAAEAEIDSLLLSMQH